MLGRQRGAGVIDRRSPVESGDGIAEFHKILSSANGAFLMLSEPCHSTIRMEPMDALVIAGVTNSVTVFIFAETDGTTSGHVKFVTCSIGWKDQVGFSVFQFWWVSSLVAITVYCRCYSFFDICCCWSFQDCYFLLPTKHETIINVSAFKNLIAGNRPPSIMKRTLSSNMFIMASCVLFAFDFLEDPA